MVNEPVYAAGAREVLIQVIEGAEAVGLGERTGNDGRGREGLGACIM